MTGEDWMRHIIKKKTASKVLEIMKSSPGKKFTTRQLYQIVSEDWELSYGSFGKFLWSLQRGFSQIKTDIAGTETAQLLGCRPNARIWWWKETTTKCEICKKKIDNSEAFRATFERDGLKVRVDPLCERCLRSLLVKFAKSGSVPETESKGKALEEEG